LISYVQTHFLLWMTGNQEVVPDLSGGFNRWTQH